MAEKDSTMQEAPDILLQIARNRRERVNRKGPEQGLNIPAERELPLVNFHKPDNWLAEDGILIAEVKRKSPSRGAIAEIPEPEALAARYAGAGFRRISVLTEETHFGGSLADLIAVKRSHPHLAVLRKDFLLSVEDVDVSFRAGADAVLLIAALLEADLIKAMYRRATSLGMTPLVEVHTRADVDKVKSFAPLLIGINSRNLRTFQVDPLLPLETRSFIDWPCDVVYESGIKRPEDVHFVRGTGFAGFLVGESLARSPELAERLFPAWQEKSMSERLYSAWNRLYSRFARGRPLVKICGITRYSDALAAEECGSDILGFIMADSPRRVDVNFIRSCADLDLLKAAIVVLGKDEVLPDEIAGLLEEGALDFVQFHGDESPHMLRMWPSYKALNLRGKADAARMTESGSPAVLIDAFSPDERGGSGIRLDESLIEAASAHGRLWIAGGLNPQNVGGIVERFNPDLVDVSTGVCMDGGEKRLKDHKKIRQFIESAKGRPEVL